MPIKILLIFNNYNKLLTTFLSLIILKKKKKYSLIKIYILQKLTFKDLICPEQRFQNLFIL